MRIEEDIIESTGAGGDLTEHALGLETTLRIRVFTNDLTLNLLYSDLKTQSSLAGGITESPMLASRADLVVGMALHSYFNDNSLYSTVGLCRAG